MDTKKIGGLAGVIAGDSAICLCGAEDESLLYRGYSVKDLVKMCSFEEVAWLLLHQDLPNTLELSDFNCDLLSMRTISPSMLEILEKMPPTVSLMDAMRSSVSLLGHLHPELEESDPLLIQERVIASLGSMLLYWYHFHTTGKRISLVTEEPSLAGHILKLITGNTPSSTELDTMNTSLILYAEHEFNASTFTVRTIASTLSDYYSAICGGIGALRGPLHGGANEYAMELITSFKTPDDAEKGILQKLHDKELIFGFGHRVYTRSDPRSSIIYEKAVSLAKTKEQKIELAIAERIEKVMKREKDLFPNLDFYSALVYKFMGIPTHFFTPLFVMSRISGWSAHFQEQRSHNKLIRPLSHYIGPAFRTPLPISERSL
jgi:2-methylcitrate synthase